MRKAKYLPSEHLLLSSEALRDDYNFFVRNLANPRPANQRYILSEKYLSGATRGVELGGFHAPNHLPLGCQADYIDQASIDDLKNRFPEINDLNCVYSLTLDDGQKLSKVPSEYYAFLIANHMIEHVEDVITTIQNHLRVIKPDGYILYAVPDKRYTFDATRELTTYEHLKDEYLNGSEKNRKEHYIDFLKHTAHYDDEELLIKTEKLLQEHKDTHFHVWESSTFEKHIKNAINDGFINATLLEIVPNGIEFICVLKKFQTEKVAQGTLS
ncbi:methyltransferase domain-containing protein [Sulfuricurvum sp.]|uniref:methyltransferase domain-containing protein n=1 Tax=Sulfuricurvum sp. TaxID=2025608 RepID=UPI002625E0C1|nr:methyltransferase domain-containing protein [Sulfuricurvum sp.]MDD2780472.1 methyltransferase domain-containing protein [Sulfuricurvum sp.]